MIYLLRRKKGLYQGCSEVGFKKNKFCFSTFWYSLHICGKNLFHPFGSLPDGVRINSIMLQRNCAPSSLLSWAVKIDFRTNRILYKPCLKHCKTVLHMYLQYNDTKKLMLKKKNYTFKSPQIKNAFHFFFSVTFLRTPQFQSKIQQYF